MPGPRRDGTAARRRTTGWLASPCSSPPSSSFWSSSGVGQGSSTTGTLNPPTAVTGTPNATGTVAVSWTASTGTPVPTGYYVTRTTGATTVAACGSSATALVAGTSCSDTAVPAGSYTYQVVAVYRSWTATSTASAAVTVVIATKLAFTTPPTTTVSGATITPAPAVTVQTAAGAAVLLSGISVTVAIGTNPSSGTLSGTATATTNTSGVATFSGLSINKAGVGYTLLATSSGLTSTTSVAFTVIAGSATKFVLTPGSLSGPASATANIGSFTVQEQDAAGNPALAPAGGTAVTLSSTSTGVKVFGASGATSGSAVTIPANLSSTTFYYGDTAAGTPTITASGTLTSATQTVTVQAGTATQLVFGQQPTNAAKNATITPAITVRVLDQFNNLVTTSTATVTIAKNTGSLVGVIGGTTTVNAVAGVATFTDLSIGSGIVLGGTGPYTLKATSGTLAAATSVSFTIS
jgi:hypothetical protein